MGLHLIALALAAGTAHTNTTTEGSVAKKTFAIGELQPGKLYGFECGTIVANNNSTDTVTLAVRFGTNATTPTSNTAIATSAAVDAATGDVAIVRGTIHVQSATRIVINTEMAESDAIGTITMKCQGPVVFTSTADTAYTLDVTADWSVAHADNQIAAANFAVWEIVP